MGLQVAHFDVEKSLPLVRGQRVPSGALSQVVAENLMMVAGRFDVSEKSDSFPPPQHLALRERQELATSTRRRRRRSASSRSNRYLRARVRAPTATRVR